MFDDELIKKTLVQELELDCPHIELIQRGVSDPIIFSGSGVIRQDDNGGVVLKLIHIFKEGQKISDSDVNMQYGLSNPGKILPDQVYFNMTCRDTFGRTWEANKIYLDNTFSYPSNSAVVKSRPMNISRKYERQHKNTNYIQFFTSYSVDLPCNKMENYSNGGSRLSIFECEFDGIKISINNSEDKLNIYSILPEDVDVKIYGEAILHALSILVGKQISPVLKLTGIGETNTMEILSERDIPAKSLPRPLKSSSPYPHEPSIEFLNNFILSYLSNRELVEELVGFWHKVFFSYSASIEVYSLALTTSIEGAFKKSFPDSLNHKKTYIDTIDSALGEIKKIEIDESIRNKILSAAGGYKKKSVKTALIDYVSSKPGYSSCPKVWSELRNQSAHADTLNESLEELQRYIDKGYICLSLFYLIILDTVSYKGVRFGYNQVGWPEVDKFGNTKG